MGKHIQKGDNWLTYTNFREQTMKVVRRADGSLDTEHLGLRKAVLGYPLPGKSTNQRIEQFQSSLGREVFTSRTRSQPRDMEDPANRKWWAVTSRLDLNVAYALVRNLRAMMDPKIVKMINHSYLPLSITSYNEVLKRPYLHSMMEAFPFAYFMVYGTGNYPEYPVDYREVFPHPLGRAILRRGKPSWHYGITHKEAGPTRLLRLVEFVRDIPGTWVPNGWQEIGRIVSLASVAHEYAAMGRRVEFTNADLRGATLHTKRLGVSASQVGEVHPYTVLDVHMYRPAREWVSRDHFFRLQREHIAAEIEASRIRQAARDALAWKRPEWAPESDQHIRWLGTQTALSEEGKTMHHCVGGYGWQVKTGQVAIYHVETSTRPFTVTLEYDAATAYRIGQTKSYANADPTPQERAEIRSLFPKWPADVPVPPPTPNELDTVDEENLMF